MFGIELPYLAIGIVAVLILLRVARTVGGIALLVIAAAFGLHATGIVQLPPLPLP